MPLSEFHRTVTKDKPEATPSRANKCSSDLFSMPDHEFAELLWENGQVVMQGHSSRPRKSSFATGFCSDATGDEEKNHRDVGDPKTSRFYAMDPMVNDFSPSGPCANIGVNAPDDDMVPWINYPAEEPLPDDTLQNDYCLEFLNEFMGANLNAHSGCSKPMATDRSSGLDQHASKAVAESRSSEPSRVRTSQLFQLSQHSQTSAPSSKSGAIDRGTGDGDRTHLQSKNAAGPKPLQLNFSNFSRPAMLAKANLRGVDRPRSNGKVSTPSKRNPVESTLIESTSGFKGAAGIGGRSTSGSHKMELLSSAKPPGEMISVEHSEAICQQEASRKNITNILTNKCGRPPDQLASSSGMATAALRRQETERAPPEAVVASSSVCSANSAGAASHDPKQREKRKSREGEESEYQSDDLEDVSVGLKNPAPGRGTSTKRSRAAEVHNLSERRRRDRINEKMRALQELIPNCNKADKASMLEEAIEYLKMLQMQVQIMSMNSGLCMPPLLLPPGMQHMHAPAAMARFLPTGLGLGMGMGFGYGMGMYDMNGSPSCSMIPVPPFHGQQFPCPSIPGPLGLHGMPGSVNHQMFGVHGQGVPLSMPRPSSSGISVKPNLVPEITAPTTRAIPASDAAPASISEDQQHQNMETLPRSNIDNSHIQNPNQEVKEPF